MSTDKIGDGRPAVKDAKHSEEHDVQAEFVLRPDRIAVFGTHVYHARPFWHIRQLQLLEGGETLQMWIRSLTLPTAEPALDALNKLVTHIQSGRRS